MAHAFPDLYTESGLKALDDRLCGKSYICGEEITKDDVKAYAVVDKPSSESYPNATKWYGAVKEKLVSSFIEDAGWGSIGGQTASAAPAGADAMESIAKDVVVEETEEKKKAAQEREAAVQASVAFRDGEAQLFRMSIPIDWKDEDGEERKKQLQDGVRNLRIKGLSWTASKLCPFKDGWKMLQILLVMVDRSHDLMAITDEVRIQLGLD